MLHKAKIQDIFREKKSFLFFPAVNGAADCRCDLLAISVKVQYHSSFQYHSPYLRSLLPQLRRQKMT